MPDKAIMIDTKDGIDMYRLLSIKYRLKIELAGMKFRGGSTFAFVKKEWGLKGNKQKVYELFCAIVERAGSEYKKQQETSKIA